MRPVHRAPEARFLVVLDADSTLISNEVIELLAAAAGSHAEVSAITDRAMHGELDFEESLRARVATLAGLAVSGFGGIAAQIQITHGARELIAGVQDAGGAVGVVSGGFHELLDALAKSLGLDYWQANCLQASDGILTGELNGSIVDAAAKASALRTWAAATGIPPAQTIAVGDGANDLQMMSAAGLSVAFNAKPLVKAHADVVIDRQDLSQVLPLLGLRG